MVINRYTMLVHVFINSLQLVDYFYRRADTSWYTFYKALCPNEYKSSLPPPVAVRLIVQLPIHRAQQRENVDG